jgi:opacity protein-like surface antigen
LLLIIKESDMLKVKPQLKTKKIILSIIIAEAFFLLPVPSHAQSLTGFYLSGKVGASLQQQRNRDISVLDTDLVTGASTGDRLKFGNHTKSVLSGGVAGGYDFNPQFNLPVRIELEYIARENGSQSRHSEHVDFDLLVPNHGNNAFHYTSSIRTQTAMLNVYWDIDTATAFRPYITTGLGLASHRFSNRTGYMMMGNTGTMRVSDTVNNFAWSLGAGVAFAINNNWSVDLGYRYIDTGKISANSSWRETYFIDARIDTKTRLDVKYHDFY